MPETFWFGPASISRTPELVIWPLLGIDCVHVYPLGEGGPMRIEVDVARLILIVGSSIKRDEIKF